MSAEIQIIQPMLGMKPFVLVEISDYEDDDAPVFGFRFAGGVIAQDVQEFLEIAAIAVSQLDLPNTEEPATDG